jgi:hypothetical protein
MPQRSVTRFFIPLIDVLTLLFCIFLMMPVVKKSDEAGPDSPEERLTKREQDVERREAELNARQDELRKDLDRIRRDVAKEVKERLEPRVLEIDAANGRLYYRNPDRVEVADQEQAHRLIRQDHDGPGGANRDFYYIIQFPRDIGSGYPTREQLREYESWFADVPLRFDIPWESPGGGKKP